VSTLYLDTSALVKRSLAEKGSGWISAWLDSNPTPTVLTSRLTIIEGVCTLARRRRPPLTFICADERLVAAAQAEGLPTENPNHHP
jgi:predicted nucleic acid-binding protein